MAARTRSRQAALNASSGITLLVMQGTLNVLTIPFLIEHLGAEIYGLIPLSSAVVSYMSVVSDGLQISVARHITVAVSSGNKQEASRLFSSALAIALLTGLVVVLGMVAIGGSAQSLFNLEPQVLGSARRFFFFNGIYYALSIISACIGSAIYAEGRLDLQYGVRLVDLLLRTGVAVVGVGLISPELKWVGFGLLVASVWTLLANLVLWQRVARGVTLDFKGVHRASLQSLLRTGGWTTVNQAGAMLHLSTDVTILSLMIGTAVAGVYGALMQWVIFLRLAVSTIANGAAPHITRSVGEVNADDAWRVAVALVRVCGVTAAIGAGVLAGSSSELLGVWLGRQFTVYGPVLAVLALAQPLNLAIVPLFTIQTATDRVRGPAVVTLLTGIVNVAISVALVRLRPIGLGVALGTLIALTLKNLFYTPIHGAKAVSQKAGDVYSAMPSLMLLTVLAWLASRMAVSVIGAASLVELAVSMLVAVVFSAVPAWFFGLDRTSRDMVVRAIPLKRLGLR